MSRWILDLARTALPVEYLRGVLDPVKLILSAVFGESLFENKRLHAGLDAAETLLSLLHVGYWLSQSHDSVFPVLHVSDRTACRNAAEYRAKVYPAGYAEALFQ